jgi:hypothetical protein
MDSKKKDLQILRTSPVKYYEGMAVRTLDDIYRSSSPTIASIRKEAGLAQLQALLTIIVIDLVEFFNVGKTMNEKQVVQTVKLIIDEFYYLKPDDFKLCFDMAKKGKLGKVYDRIDGAVIMEWLNNYVRDRMEFFEQRSIEKYQAELNEDLRYLGDSRQQRLMKEDEFHRIKAAYYRESISKRVKQ